MKPILVDSLNYFALFSLLVAFLGEFVAGPEAGDALFWAGIIGAISAWLLKAYLTRNDHQHEDE